MARAKVASKKEKKSTTPEREKVVRDSYTMPQTDYLRLKGLKKQFLEKGVHVKKSELLRAGLLALEALSDTGRMKLLQQVERVKTGRPGKDES